MAKDDDWVKAGLIITGALILGKILSDAFKQHRCPRCNYPVSRDNIMCPNCGQPLNWEGVE